jgi:hypothetical protein
VLKRLVHIALHIAYSTRADWRPGIEWLTATV